MTISKDKLFKIALAIAAAVLFIVTAVPASADDGTEWSPSDFTYEEYEKTVYGCDYSRTINLSGRVVSGMSESGLEKLKSNKNLVLPSTDTSGAAVIGVGNGAFRNMGLESVRFPSGMMIPYDDELTGTVTKRGNYIICESAFSGNELTEVNLPEGILAVLPNAFFKNKIKHVSFPSTVWWIETLSFARNEIESITFPGRTHFSLEMHGMAFAYNNIRAVRLPDTTAVVNKDVFDANPGMEEVSPDAPAGQKEIGGGVVYMFTGDAGIKELDRVHSTHKTVGSQRSWHQKVVLDGEADDPDTYNWSQKDFTYTISEGHATVTGLSQSGEERRALRRELVIPDHIIDNGTRYSVTAIADAEPAGNGLFAQTDDDFDRVVLPYYLERIGDFAFQSNGIEEVSFPPQLRRIGTAAFQTNDLTAVILPDTVNEMGSGAFATNPLLERLSLSAGLTTIPDAAFGCSDKYHYMTGLKEISLHEGLTEIGSRAFAGNNFREIVLPSTMRTVGSYAFSTKNYLSDHCRLELNEGLVNIGDNAFRNKVISAVGLPESVAALPANTFRKEYSDGRDATLTRVMVSSADQYNDRAAFPESEYHKLYLTDSSRWTEDDFEYEGGTVTGLSEQGNMKIELNTSLVIPETTDAKEPVAAIAADAFRGLGIEKLTLNCSSCSSIGDNAFAYNRIRTVQLPSRLDTLSASAFAYNFYEPSDSSFRVVRLYFDGNADAEKLHYIGHPEAEDNIFQELVAGSTPEWRYEDFDISGTVLRGLTESGMKKLEDNTSLILPDKNSEGEWITEIASTDGYGLFKYDDGEYIYTPEEVELPSHLVRIGDRVFMRDATETRYLRDGITGITFPDSLEAIGQMAFQHQKLRKVVLPQGLCEMGSAAFGASNGSGTITELRLSGSLTDIPSSAFFAQRIESLRIPSGVKTVGSRAFSGCAVGKLTLPETLENIGDYAFENHQLKELVIPDRVTGIGRYAFKVYAEGHEKTLSYLKLGSGLRSLGKEAFCGSDLSTVDIPDSLEDLPSDAFKAGTRVVTLRTSVKDPQGSDRFILEGECHRVVYDPLANKEWSSEDFTYEGTAITGLSDSGKAMITANGTEHMLLPDINPEGESITEIADGAFAVSPSDVEQQKYDVISPMGIESVTLPEELERIGDKAFEYNNLTEISFGSSMKSIGESAFHGNKLEKVSIPDTVTQLGDGAFAMNSITELKLSEGLTAIPQGAFAMNIRMTSVRIPERIEEIGDEAFAGARLEALDIPDSVVKIGKKAFHLHRITELEIPGTVREIGESAFEGTYKGLSLRKLTLGEGIESIGRHAFKEGLLTEVNLPSSLRSLGADAFLNNEGINGSNVVRLYTKNPDHKSFKTGSSCEIVLIQDEKIKIKSITLSSTSYIYNGKKRRPAVTVRGDNGKVLTEGRDYRLSGSLSAVKPGDYTVKAVGIGSASGEVKKGYSIRVKGTSIRSLKRGKRSFTVKVAKLSGSYVSGYQVQYSRSSAMTSSGKAYVGRKYSAVRKTVKKLKGGKKYYVRVRAYRSIGGKKYYSSWSKRRSVTVGK